MTFAELVNIFRSRKAPRAEIEFSSVYDDKKNVKREKAERELKEKTEREAKEKAERELKEKTEREAKEKAERELKEKTEREAKEKAERELKGKTKHKAKEKASNPARSSRNNWPLVLFVNVLLSALLTKLAPIAAIANLPVAAQLAIFFVALLVIELVVYKLVQATGVIKTKSGITAKEATLRDENHEQDHSFTHRYGLAINPLRSAPSSAAIVTVDLEKDTDLKSNVKVKNS